MKALVLAGGLPQIALIKNLKSRDIKVVIADYLDDPIAKPFADKFYQISTLDIDRIIDLSRKENVDFVITVCTDQALLTMAKVSEELGLPCYIDYQTALNVTNKAYMKKVFKEQGISTANFIITKDVAEKDLKRLKYPLIVKPVDCNSSKGVKQVSNFLELQEAFDVAKNFSRTGNVIIEEFVSGLELSVDVYIENGNAKVLLVSELDKIPEKDKFIIFRSKTPTSISEKTKCNIKKVAQQIADAFKITNSPMLIQLIAKNDDVFVLEFSARTGGGEKFVMIEKMTGFDVVKAVVDLTLGSAPNVNAKSIRKALFATEFIYCKEGEFDHIKNFEELKQQEVISEYYCFKAKGSKFSKIESSGDRVAGFSIIATTKEELEAKHNAAVSNLQVIDKDGKNIMRYDLLPDLYI